MADINHYAVWGPLGIMLATGLVIVLRLAFAVWIPHAKAKSEQEIRILVEGRENDARISRAMERQTVLMEKHDEQITHIKDSTGDLHRKVDGIVKKLSNSSMPAYDAD